MIRFLAILLFISAQCSGQGLFHLFLPNRAGGAIITPPDGNNGGGPTDAAVILIMGQSNAQGVNYLGDLPADLQGPQTNDVVWNAGEWQPVNATLNTVDITLQPNTSGSDSGRGWGAIMNAGKYLKADYGKKIYFIQNHLGGLNLFHWFRPDGDKWEQLEDYVNSAFQDLRDSGLTPYPLAIMWAQGEADIQSGPTYYGPYYDSLTALMAATRGLDETLANTPWINFSFGKEQTGLGDARDVLRTLLNSIFYRITYDDPAKNWVINIDTADFHYLDNVHWDVASALNAGILLRNFILKYPKYNQQSTEATNAISAIESSGYVMSDAEKGLLRDYIAGLKASGIWDKITARWLFMGDRAGSAKVNIRNPGTFDLVEHGAISYDPANGITPDGTTGYYETGINPSTDITSGDVGIGIWCDSVVNHANQDFGCKDASSRYFTVGYYGSNGNTEAWMTGANSPASSFMTASNYSYVNYDGDSVIFYRDGIRTGASAKSPSTLPDAECYFSGYNNNGTTTYGNHNYNMATVTKSLTPAEAMLDYKLSEIFMQGLNRFRN